MFPHEREAKVTLNKKRRTPTPDEQDLEITRESKKIVSLGEDFVESFESNLKSGKINAKVESGIKLVMLEAEKKRAKDSRIRQAYVVLKTSEQCEENSEID